MGQFHDRRSALPNSSRSAGVQKDGSAHLAPVIVMGDAPRLASMPPMMMGTSLNASRTRWL